MGKSKHYFWGSIFPALLFGALTGILTAAVVMIYKFCAKQVIAFSEQGYHLLRGHLYLVPAVLLVLFGVAVLFSICYRRHPNLGGGGIPTSIGILRGVVSFRWLKNLVGIFGLSLVSFLIGVPLGNEGPSVQMGTVIGSGTVRLAGKEHRAWDRYSMTGGACAGFSIATGAPLSGIMFAIEEAHQRISPMIIIVSSVSVLFAYLTTEILAPILSVDPALFPTLSMISLRGKDLWLPIVIGVVLGLFSVVFLRFYHLISSISNQKLKMIPLQYRIFLVFLLTVFLGLCSGSFISTGHELALSLFEPTVAIHWLAVVLLVRAALTLFANTNSITGGMFLPMLALGAIVASILGKILIEAFGLGNEYYVIILVLGITGCVAGMMKMPLTAVLFSVEALSCYNNMIWVIIVSAISFAITEVFGAKSINESVLENKMHKLHDGKEAHVIDAFITVQPGAFVVGKQMCDVFWPANFFVLSLERDHYFSTEVVEHGGEVLCEGDILHVRYTTFDAKQTNDELFALVGEQMPIVSTEHRMCGSCSEPLSNL